MRIAPSLFCGIQSLLNIIVSIFAKARVVYAYLERWIVLKTYKEKGSLLSPNALTIREYCSIVDSNMLVLPTPTPVF